MTGPRIGSLCSGAGMLDEGVRAAIGGTVAWHCEHEPATEKNPRPRQAAARVLAHHYPGVPNHGDLTTVDWAAVEPVDVLTGGTPCQDVSHAGKRAGMRAGTRSGLWASMVDAIAVLRPQLVVWENVRGVLSAEADSALEPCPGCVGDGDDGAVLRALGRVLGDLADLGYDARWCGLRAADVGAPHGRFRVFVTAWPAADAERVRRDWRPPHPRRDAIGRAAAAGTGAEPAADSEGDGLAPLIPGRPEPQRSGTPSGPPSVADPGGKHREQRRESVADQTESGRAFGESSGCGRARTSADAASDGRDEGWPESAGLVWGPDAALGSPGAPADADDDSARHRSASSGASGGGAEPAQRGAAAHTNGSRLGGERGKYAVGRDSDRCGRPHGAGRAGQPTAPAADSDSDGLRLESVTEPGISSAPVAADAVQWGVYEPAIRRWERLTRPAPTPTEAGPKGGQRLSARFTEWMQGWPDGWVTDVPGVSRNDALRICGNGVVPQQAEAALRIMLPELAAA